MLPPPVDHVPPPLTAEQRQHRARVVARAGEIVVTIGEVEDHLAESSQVERDAFRTPAGRRGVVSRLLRRHLLAAESQRRGATDGAMQFRALRAEERALRDLLEVEVRRDPGPIPAPSEPIEIPERRFAVILRNGTRADHETWRRECASADTPFTQALARAEVLGDAQETPYGERDAPPDTTPTIDAQLWRALFELDGVGSTSRTITVDGQLATVFYAGLAEGYTQTGPDEGARRMLAADRAWTELVTQVRSDRVRDYDASAIDGVAFRMTPDRSVESMNQLGEEVARAQARATAEAERAEEGP